MYRKQGKQSSFLFGRQDHMPVLCITAVVLFPLFLLGGGGLFCVDLYLKFKDRFNKFIYCFICKNATKHLMENQSIYYKICNVQISCHNFDPVRLLSIRLLRSLDRSLWVGGHFPPESNDDSLPWLLYKSFFYGRIPLSDQQNKKCDALTLQRIG